jgi:acyl dehydratase
MLVLAFKGMPRVSRYIIRYKMTEKEKAGYYQITVGYEFPPQSYTLDSSIVSTYLEAVKESNDLYRIEGLVPPLAVTAYAMAALSAGISLPSGTVHVSQELEFTGLVHAGDTITCYSKVSRRQDRGGLHIMATDITVVNQKQEKVLSGRVGFILPEPNAGNK